MNEDLIRKTEQGDVSGFPGIQDILSKLGGNGGWDAVAQTAAGEALNDSLASKREELQRDYHATFGTPHGQRVLEDILDQTFRRAPVAPSKGQTFEQLTPYVVERNGQNSMAFYVCMMFGKGRKLPSRSAKKKKAA